MGCLHDRLPGSGFKDSQLESLPAGKVLRSECPLAGSREHYSLVNGGKILAEEIPERKKLNLAL